MNNEQVYQFEKRFGELQWKRWSGFNQKQRRRVKDAMRSGHNFRTAVEIVYMEVQ